MGDGVIFVREPSGTGSFLTQPLEEAVSSEPVSEAEI
jgi:hypothetical protein